MFSNLSKGSILYVLQTKDTFKLSSGTITEISLPRPRYTTVNPNNVFGQPVETVVDIVATIDGERREFKGVPNTSIANFGDSNFVLAENKEVLDSYISSMLQNSRSIVNSMEKHQKLIENYEIALGELNPSVKDNKAIESLQNQVNTLQDSIKVLLEKLNGNTN